MVGGSAPLPTKESKVATPPIRSRSRIGHTTNATMRVSPPLDARVRVRPFEPLIVAVTVPQRCGQPRRHDVFQLWHSPHCTPFFGCLASSAAPSPVLRYSLCYAVSIWSACRAGLPLYRTPGASVPSPFS